MHPTVSLMASEFGAADNQETVGWNDLSFLDAGESHSSIPYVLLAASDLVSPAHILATASDEPDRGHGRRTVRR